MLGVRKMQQNGWKLLFEDKEILVVCKDPGVATQSGNLRTLDLVNRLRNYRSEKGENPEIFLIHRLDQPVGGILVFGKTKKAAASLSAQIQNNTMEKYYKVVVEGKTESKGHIENYLLQDRKTSSAEVVEKGTGDAKKAVLDFSGLNCLEEKSLLEVKLGTGRFHQIRVQMANYGHPICGDNKYNPRYKGDGGEELRKPKGNSEKIFPALFAWKLIFNHPITGKRMEFQENPTYGYFSEF